MLFYAFADATGQGDDLTCSQPIPAGTLSQAAGKAVLFYSLMPSSGKLSTRLEGVFVEARGDPAFGFKPSRILTPGRFYEHAYNTENI